MTLQKIEFEYDIPDGYRFVRFGRVMAGEEYIDGFGLLRTATIHTSCDFIVVEKISEQEQPAQNPKRHKHADLIHAWAEGATIQFQKKDKSWDDVFMNFPNWDDAEIYRIKPKTKIIRFRSYLDRYFGTVKVARSGVPSDLGKWLGDWQEFEVEE